MCWLPQILARSVKSKPIYQAAKGELGARSQDDGALEPGRSVLTRAVRGSAPLCKTAFWVLLKSLNKAFLALGRKKNIDCLKRAHKSLARVHGAVRVVFHSPRAAAAKAST